MTAEGPSAAVQTAPAPPPPPGEPPALPGARHALLLLVLINLFNYIDRQVLAALEPNIREAFFTDPSRVASAVGLGAQPGPLGPLALAAAVKQERLEQPAAKTLMGLLSFAFLATYMFTAPLFGALSTRMSRWLLIGIGVAVWSLASGASGLAPYLGSALGGGAMVLFGYVLPTAYLVMLLTRCLVGIGEAVYGPVAPDVISDLYPVQKRGQVLAWFYAAIPVGGALGYALGAEVVKRTGHWEYAFYLVVPPGLLLGLWCLLMPEPPRGQTDQAKHSQREPRWSDYLFLMRTPSYALNTAGMTAMCFAMGGLAYWAAGFLKYSNAPEPIPGIDPVFFFGILTASMGLLATIAGGLAGDALRGRFSGSYFLVSGIALCLAFPMLLLMVELRFPLAWFPLAGFVFCLFFNTGPTNTILANVVHPQLRARGFALNILVIHLFGDAISPAVMGAIIGNENRYKLAFQVVAFTVLLGGLLWLCGIRYLQRDTELAPTRLPPE